MPLITPPKFFCTPQPFQNVIAMLIGVAGAVMAWEISVENTISSPATSNADPAAEAAGIIQYLSNMGLATCAGTVAGTNRLVIPFHNKYIPLSEAGPGVLDRNEIAPSVLPYVIGVVDGLSVLVGSGTPYNAEDIEANSRFRNILSRITKDAFPSDRWQGLGAQIYTQRNQISSETADILNGYDRRLVDCIKRQADLVDATRMILAALTLLLCAAYVWEMWMKTADINCPPIAAESAIEANENAFFCSALGTSTAIAMIGIAAALEGWFGSEARDLREDYQSSPAWHPSSPAMLAWSSSTAFEGLELPTRNVATAWSWGTARTGDLSNAASKTVPLSAASVPAGPARQKTQPNVSPSEYTRRHPSSVNHATGQRSWTATSSQQQDQEVDLATSGKAALAGTTPTEADHANATSTVGPTPMTLSH